MSPQQHRVRDEENLFLDAVVMAAGTTGAITDHDSAAIDLGVADVDEVGATEAIVDVTTAMTSGGSATINFQWLDCDTLAGSYAVLTPVPSESGVKAFDAAELLVAAEPLRIPLPKFGVRQFVKLRYVVGAATITGGVLDAWLAKT